MLNGEEISLIKLIELYIASPNAIMQIIYPQNNLNYQYNLIQIPCGLQMTQDRFWYTKEAPNAIMQIIYPHY